MKINPARHPARFVRSTTLSKAWLILALLMVLVISLKPINQQSLKVHKAEQDVHATTKTKSPNGGSMRGSNTSNATIARDSSTATVFAMATGYDLKMYQRFVGSLRSTGYKGHIILGIHSNPSQIILDYFKERDVTPKLLSFTECTYSKKHQCSILYPDIKIQWSRFPLIRSWLTECTTCTGPVLVTDSRDALFQLDPFGPGSPPVNGLQVFQEHLNQTTKHWLTEKPIRECKGLQYDEPMLCSGTTIGTRETMLEYLDIMYEEMKLWVAEPNNKCRFDSQGDDQAIHNYLFYAGKLPFAKSIPNREGIVHTIGIEGGRIIEAHVKNMRAQRLSIRTPLAGADEKTWIGTEYGLTNDLGLITNFDGSVSRVVHQFDRLDFRYTDWLKTQPWARDNS